ncbi:amidase [Carnobacteriaceae bacterium zg-C25]|nr:amidase [Carnobacteriaceae bacterium zg-C25]
MHQDALEIARQIKKGEVSAKEVVLETIKRIEDMNGTYRALVSERFEQALQESQQLDFSKAFAGVPILLKDLGQQLKGEKNTSGAKLFEHYVSQHTDHYTQKLLDLGFIVVGQTATCEFGFKNYTQSRLHGTTVNAHDCLRHAGGSSGEAASAVASGMVSVAGASDGGGSIRIPASWQGLIGLKTSRGRIPSGPSSYRGWQGASVNFVLANSLESTQSLFYHMQTEQFESPFTLPLAKPFASRPLRVAFSVTSPVGTVVSEDAKRVVIDTVKRLSELGCEVVETAPQLDGIALMKGYYKMNGAETVKMIQHAEKSIGRKVERSDMEDMSWLIYQSGKQILASEYSRVLDEWDHANAIMQQFHQTYDVLIQPTNAFEAPLVSQYGVMNDVATWASEVENCSQSEKEQFVWDMFMPGLTLTPFTQQANLTGQPAITLPLGTSANGMPMGVQVTAAKGMESLLFDVAKRLMP